MFPKLTYMATVFSSPRLNHINEREITPLLMEAKTGIQKSQLREVFQGVKPTNLVGKSESATKKWE